MSRSEAIQSSFAALPAPSRLLGVGKGALYAALGLLPGGFFILLVLFVVRRWAQAGGSMRVGVARTPLATLPVRDRVIDATLSSTRSAGTENSVVGPR